MQTTRQHIAALTDRTPINGHSVLIEQDRLERIVFELSAALEPCGDSRAKVEAQRLAAC